MSTPSIPTLTIRDRVAEIRFGDPDRRNALCPEFWDNLPRLCAQIDSDPGVRAVIIRSEGPHFCSGIDLGYLKSLLPNAGADPARDREQLRRNIVALQDVINAVADCRVPVIAVVQGACMGGGLDLVAAADMIYASDDAAFTIQETNIGLTADLGSLQRLPQRMAAGLLRELAYTGRTMHAQEALSAGLVTSLHKDHAAATRHAREIAATIGTRSPLAVLGIKQAFRMDERARIRDGLDHVATWNAGLISIPDIEEALGAVRTKAAAQYRDLSE